MKQGNKVWKRLLALAVVLTMVIQCVNGLSLVSRANETSGYTELTSTDIATNIFSSVSNNLNGHAFTAKMTFSAGGYIRIAGDNDSGGWVNTLEVKHITDNGGELQLSWLGKTGHALTNSDGTPKRNKTDHQAAMVTGTEYVVRLTFDIVNTTDVLVKVFIDKEAVGEFTFTEVVDGYFGTRIEKSGVTLSPYEAEYDFYTRVTPLDFGYPDFAFANGTHGNASTPHTSKALNSDGTLADLNGKYLDMDVTFTSASDYMVYASSGGWHGIKIFVDADNVLHLNGTVSGSGTITCPVASTGIALGETFNLKIYTKIVDTDIVLRVIVTSATKTYEVDPTTFSGITSVGNELAVYTPSGTITVATPVTTTKEIGPYSYDLDKGNYLVVEKNARLNGTALATGSELSDVGNYVLVMEQDGVTIKKTIVLYKVGDVDLNGTVEPATDLTALQAMLAEATDIAVTTAAHYGADLDNDNKVTESDLALMQAIVDGDTTLDEVKEKYHVAALTYDYLSDTENSGDEVMPIVGYYGPYKTADADFTTDEIMQLVVDSGVNMVNFAPSSYWGYPSYNLNLLDALHQYDKFGLGYYVSHYDWLTDDTAAQVAQMGNYGNYTAVLGSHIIDEPTTDINDYYSIASYLNKYTNTNAFMNLVPEDNATVGGDDYSTYWDNYITNVTPKVLSVDDYPFNDSADEGVANAIGYFTSLATIREKAGTSIPFWYYVQAGGDFKGSWESTNADLQPTAEETYWNVNTALAFGAKGIEWYPLIQPTSYATATDGTTDYEKNGLIGADATSVTDIAEAKTDFYDTAVQANKQIEAVDEVLMKASSKGIIATGGYAASQTTGLTGMMEVSGTDKLDSIGTDDTTYGALIGCFDYKDTEAYYVVNYNVEVSQYVTLNFVDGYNYRTINYDGETAAYGTSCTLTIPAGEAVLVVMDELVEPQDPYVIYPADFGIASDTYTGTAAGAAILTSGQYAPTVKGAADISTLEGTILSADVEFSGNARINLGHIDSNYYGLSIMTNTNGTENLVMRWEDKIDGVSANSTNRNLLAKDVKALDSTITALQGVTFNLKVSLEVVDSDGNGRRNDIKVGVWINDHFYADSSTEDGYTYYVDRADRLGKKLAVRTDTAGSYVKIGTPRLNFKDYTTITTTDIGLAQAIYTPYSGNCAGRYDGESMDGVLFSANLDFKESTNNYIRFCGRDGDVWYSLQWDINSSGNLRLKTNLLTARGYATNTTVDYGTVPTGVFNFRVSIDYVDIDRDGEKDDVKMGVWIDDTLVNNRYTYYIDMVPYIGNNIIFAAPHYAKNATDKETGEVINPFDYTVVEEFTVLAAPITKELGATAYDLTGTEGYTVPGTTTTYTNPGEYEVSFEDKGVTYSGDVTLYYEGDANMDGKADIRDLVRSKVRTNPYEQFTFSDAGTVDLTKASMVEGAVTKFDSMDMKAFRGKVTYNDRTNTDADGAPHNDRLYVGVDASTTWKTDNGGLYIYYNHGSNEIAVNRFENGVSTSTPYSVAAVADTLIGETVEYYITFKTEGEGIKAVICINNTKIAEVSLDTVGFAVHAYSANGTMTIESVAEEEALTAGTAVYRSTDVNNNGAIDEADSSALRSVLVGKEAEKETVFGVISDTHFLGNGGDTERQERFEKALTYYREQGAELIILNADLTDYGNAGSYQALISIANEVYKDTPVALRPQFVATADNHEFYESWDWTTWGTSIDLDAVTSRFSTYLSGIDTKLVAGDTNLNTSRTINGYTFIGVSRDGEDTASAAFDADTLDWLDKELATAQEANPSKPIFVAIHQPPTNTVSASGTDGTAAYNAVLAKYPQVVLFTSHTHAALEDEHSLYQGDYTVVNTGAVYYVAGLGKDINGGVSFENSSTTDIYEFAQALLVKANGTKVDIQRCNFLGDESATIKYNWTFDVANPDSFATYTEARRDTQAPTFADGATATYNSATGVLTFPAASDNDFVYYYEITVDGTTYNYLTDFYQGIPQMDTTCAFKLSGATSDSVITISAVDSYGNKTLLPN